VARKTSFAGIQPIARGPHRVAVVAFDGLALGDAAAPLELFSRTRDPLGRKYEVRLCSAKPRITTQHASLEVPWRLSAVARADTVIVPGIDDLDRPIEPAVTRAIARAIERGARVASICTGAFLLARTGALDGMRATTHWRAADELARRHPRIRVDANVLYVDNGSLLTAAGAAAGFDLCLYLIRRDLGAAIAAASARDAVLPLERAGGQAQFIDHEPPTPEGNTLTPVLAWITANLQRELPLPVIARKAALSTRTLSRRFREQVGTTPALWVTRARVHRAQRLLETTDLSIERLACEVGFGSAAVLRERFAALVGTTPQAYRRSFRTLPSARASSPQQRTGSAARRSTR
jgi:transcriptional regulator GlxA family with amidase domain